MIGKISKVDWGEAPLKATHVSDMTKLFYKLEVGKWQYWLSDYRLWKNSLYPDILKLITKEEDLEMDKVKEVKCANDLEVGMFIRWFNGGAYLLLTGNKAVHIISGTVYTECSLSGVVDWSYTYNGPYTPIIIKETPEQKKLKELQDESNKLKETAAKIEQQIAQLLKG